MHEELRRQAETALRASQRRLEVLIERATHLRERMEAEASLLQSMERLAAQARTPAPAPPARPERPERDDDGSYLASEGWEIALIGEDGR